MAESPPVKSPPPRPRRRWLRRVVLGFLLLLLAVWLVRVPLANWWLRRLPGDWAVSISGLRPGFSSLTLEGVRVRHRPTGKQLAYAEQVDAANGWSRMVKGELGALTLTGADVEWRPEFETPYIIPPEGGPPASVIVSWQSGTVNGGAFKWYRAGQDLPRLSLRITGWSGGEFAIYNDGRVEAASQNIFLADVVSRELAADGEVEIEARTAEMSGRASAQRELNRYTINNVNSFTPSCRVVWRHRRGVPAESPPSSGSARPAWDKPAEFFIGNATILKGPLEFTIHPLDGAPVEGQAELAGVRIDLMRLAGGLPWIFWKLEVTLRDLRAPAATNYPKALLNVKQAVASLSRDEDGPFQFGVSIDQVYVNDTTKLLLAAGVPAEMAKNFPVCDVSLNASLENLTAGSDGVSSPSEQRIWLNSLSAVLPGEKDPLLRTQSTELKFRPEEIWPGKRMREVTAEYADVKITENAFTDELNPLHSGEPAPGGTPSPPPDKPRWYGWHTDSLTVRKGRARGVDMGTGIPDAKGDLRVETVVRPPGDEKYYRAHITNISPTNPLLSVLPKIESTLEVDIHPLRVYETESVDEVRVNGVKVELSEALLKLFQAADKPAPEPQDADAPGTAAAQIP